MTTQTWTWMTANDDLVEVEPIPFPAEFEWYPEGPGQRPPVLYQMTYRASGEVTTQAVFPYEPWSPAEALSDILTARGWTDMDVQEDEGICDHGLSLSLCAGPGHYPEDEF